VLLELEVVWVSSQGWCVYETYCRSMRFWSEQSAVVGRQARLKRSLLRSTKRDIAV
jgi:hypothetical protein